MLKDLIRKIILQERASSESYVRHLRNIGVSVGDDVVIYSPLHTQLDLTCPWLLSIGDHVRITHGVIILTHDFSWSVLKRLPQNAGRILGAQSPVSIGNNVFIGMNAIVTRGVTIGDNVVIGAGSVVTKDCESNSVYAGNPARKIMTIEEYLRKRENAQFEEAKNMARIYRDKFSSPPTQEVFREYFMLFSSVDEAMQIPDFRFQMGTCNNLAESELYMREHEPMFESYEAFLNACYQED